MSKTIAQETRNVFQHQSHPSNRQRSRGDVMQERVAHKSDRAASHQSAPPENVSRPRPLDTNSYRVNKLDNTKVKLADLTLHVHPIDKAELKHIATEDGLSVSKVGATAVHEWILWKIHKREENLLYPKLKQLLREDREKEKQTLLLARLVYEAGLIRGITTNILGRTEGINQELLETIIKGSENSALANITRWTPQVREILRRLEKWLSEEGKRSEQ